MDPIPDDQTKFRTKVIPNVSINHPTHGDFWCKNNKYGSYTVMPQ